MSPEDLLRLFLGNNLKRLKQPQIQKLSGPLNRLNAIQSLLQPLDRYRGPSAILVA